MRFNLTRSLKLFGQTLPLLIIAGAGLTAWLMGRSVFDNFWNIYLGLMLEVLPFFMLGAILAALIAPLRLPDMKIWRTATRNRATAATAGLVMGFALPVCECGTASVARQTNRAGAPAILSLVFLMAAPVVNPVTILVTYLAFNGNWLIILGRSGLALVVALVAGLILSLYPKPADLFVSTANENNASDQHDHDHEHDHEEGILPEHGELPRHGKVAAFNGFLERAIEELLEAVRVGLPGIALAAAFQACVPSQYFLGLGQGALFSVIALMLLAALMAICSSADAFVALSFSGLVPAGSVLAFLVFGPLINLKSIFLFRLVLRWRTIGLLALFSFSLILPAALFINYWLA